MKKKSKISKKTFPLKKPLILISVFLSFVFLIIGYYNFRTTKKQVTVLDGLSYENTDKIKIENQLKTITQGYPIEKMLPFILEKDPKVIAFLVSIAKKESNLGKRAPKLNGQDCFNYWGFRAQRARMGSGGHTCFDNPEDAVDTVSARIEDLINKNVDTPAEMIVWKCGSSCAGHNPSSVSKWINDVRLYFNKAYPKI
jgi:hypothetical protein